MDQEFPSTFFCLSAETNCRETLWCLTRFGYRKIICLRGLCHDFLSKLLRLALPKNLVGEPFCVSQTFWSRRLLWERGWQGGREGVSKLSVEFCFVTSIEKFRTGDTLVLLLFRVSKNVRCKGEGIRIFRQNFCLCAKNFRRRKPLVCHLFRIPKSSMLERTVTIFCRNFFLSRSIEKLRRGALLCVSKSLVSKTFMEKSGRRRREGGNVKVIRPSFLSQCRKNSQGTL